jgi:hypothetical protein
MPPLGNEEALASYGAWKDPLRANFSGAALVKADITGAIFLTQIFQMRFYGPQIKGDQQI